MDSRRRTAEHLPSGQYLFPRSHGEQITALSPHSAQWKIRWLSSMGTALRAPWPWTSAAREPILSDSSLVEPYERRRPSGYNLGSPFLFGAPGLGSTCRDCPSASVFPFPYQSPGSSPIVRAIWETAHASRGRLLGGLRPPQGERSTAASPWPPPAPTPAPLDGDFNGNSRLYADSHRR